MDASCFWDVFLNFSPAMARVFSHLSRYISLIGSPSAQDWYGSCLPIRSGRLLSGKAESGPSEVPAPHLPGGAGIKSAPASFQTLIRVEFVPNVKGLTIKKA
jgi:hypothetical protein